MIIPKSFLAELGLAAGDTVDMHLEDGRLILAPVKMSRRGGWAQALRTVAAMSDDALVWPEFGNAGAANLT